MASVIFLRLVLNYIVFLSAILTHEIIKYIFYINGDNDTSLVTL